MFPCLLLAAAVSFGVPGALAENGWWEPPNIAPTQATQSEVLEAITQGLGSPAPAYRQRVETYAASAPNVTFTARELIRGDDFRLAAELGGKTYGFRRSGGSHWRQTPAGLVHLVLSDVQGDDLDRWPTAYVSDDHKAWRLVGQTRGSDADWVLLERGAYDLPHWFYVDQKSGRIVREITHEGIREETTTFDDFRRISGTWRPYAWHVRGEGPNLDVAVTALDVRPVAASEVAIPGSASTTLLEPLAPQPIPATFSRERITVPLGVNGKAMHFILDTGTPQIVLSGDAAARAHLAPLLGHATAADVAIAGVTSHDVPVYVTSWGGDGILGYEFFSGRIVHIDYLHSRLEVLPRDGFAAPSDAREFSVDYNEGMPLVSGRIGDVSGARFVLDTGSWRFVLTRELQADHPWRDSDMEPTGTVRRVNYLEGGIDVVPMTAASLRFGAAHFTDVPAQREVSGPETEFPIDGIIGTDELANFEWWFDADGQRAWMRR